MPYLSTRTHCSPWPCRLCLVAAVLLTAIAAPGHARPDPERTFHVLAKVKRDAPSATQFYGGSELSAASSIALEVLHGSPGHVLVGGGAEYQFYKDVANYQASRRLTFLPVYAKMYAFVRDGAKMDVFLGGQAGYSFQLLDGAYYRLYTAKGGMHLGFSGGIVLEDVLLFEGSLTLHGGQLHDRQNGLTRDSGYIQASLGLGILFP